MSAPAMSFDDWAETLRKRTQRGPQTARAALRLAQPGRPLIGSIEPSLAQRIAAAGLPLRRVDDAWQVEDDANTSLAAIARWQQAQGIGGRWRDELLGVVDDLGRTRAAIERAAVRPLGITTHAVHLIGRHAAGDYWLQQRAFDKCTDPGLWDTLVGGLVAHGESVETTLERETWEEAGLHIDALHDLVPLGRVTVRRPLAEGYMVEHMDLFEATLPDQLEPINQDGEVQGFERVGPTTLIERLCADAFTLEAGLALLASLRRRGPRSA